MLQATVYAEWNHHVRHSCSFQLANTSRHDVWLQTQHIHPFLPIEKCKWCIISARRSKVDTLTRAHMTTVTHGTGFGCDSDSYNHDVQHEDDKVTGDTEITDLGRGQFNTMHSLHFTSGGSSRWISRSASSGPCRTDHSRRTWLELQICRPWKALLQPACFF